MSTVQFGIEYVESHGKSFALPQAVVVHSRRSDEIGRWYRQFGFEVFKQQTDDGQTYITARCTGLLLKIHTVGMTPDAEQATLYFVVDDFEATLGAIAALNATVTTAPLLSFGRRRVVLTDPDGRRVVLTERTVAPAEWIAPVAPFLPVAPNQAASSIDEEEDEAERRRFDRAFNAVRRGAGMELIAILLYLTAIGVFIYLVWSLPPPRDLRWLNTELAQLPLRATTFLMVLSLLAKVLTSLPRTTRVGYWTLWTAIIIEAATGVTTLALDFGPDTRYWFAACYFLGLTTPALHLTFLARFMREADRFSESLHADVTFVLYVIWALFFGGTVAYVLASPKSVEPIRNAIWKWSFVILSLALFAAYLTILIRIAFTRRRHVVPADPDGRRVMLTERA